MVDEKTTLRPLAQELGQLIGTNDLSIILKAAHLEITASVDRRGLRDLIEMLGHYEVILDKVNGWSTKQQ